MAFWNWLGGGKPAPPAKTAAMSRSKPKPGLQTYEHLLLVSEREETGSVVNHLVILKANLVNSIGSSTGSSFEGTAAVVAGQLFACRSGDPIKKDDVIASGNEVARKATVTRHSNIRALVGDQSVPAGWENVPIVGVAWKTF